MAFLYGRRLAAVILVLLVISASVPVAAAEVNWSRVEVISSGNNSIRYIHVAFNPCTGHALIVGWNGYMTLYNKTSLVRVQTNTLEMLQSVAWKPDCSEALAVGQNGTVLRYKDGVVTKLNSGITNLLQDVAWTNEGKAIIAAGKAGVLWWDGTQFTNQSLPDSGYETFGIAWNPKASWGVLVGQKLSIYRFSTNSIAKLPAPLGVDASLSLYKASFKPDGSAVTIVGKNGTILNYDGTNYPDVVSGGSGTFVTFLDVSWRPDGDFAVIVGDSGSVLCFRKQNDFPHLPTADVWGLLYSVDWASDNSIALVVGNNGVVLRYPATVHSPVIQFNPVMMAGLAILIILVLCGIAYLYVVDRRERLRAKTRKNEKRSKHHGRRSRRRR